MSTTVYEQQMFSDIITRERLESQLRAAITQVQAGDLLVTFLIGNIEVSFDYENDEIRVVA